jgi:hypothetical protein
MSAAAQREDRCLAASDTMNGALLSKVGAKLGKLGLVREMRAKAGTPVWRRDDSGQAYALKLTAAGLKAIAIDEEKDQATEPSETLQTLALPDATDASCSDDVAEQAKTLAPRPGSKLARVINLLQRPNGATIV